MKKIMGVTLFVLIIFTSVCPLFVMGAESGAEIELVSFNKEGTYTNYLQKHKDISSAETDITIPASSFFAASEDAKISISSEFQGEKDILLWESLGGSAEWKITAPKDAMYAVELTYFVLNDESRNVEFSLTIDGSLPFDTSANIVLPRLFQNTKEIETDARGNDIRPDQSAYKVWLVNSFRDNAGVYNEPYQFYLSAGEHTLKLTGVRAKTALKSIRLYKEQELPAYAEYSKNAKLSTDVKTEYIQGEAPFCQTDSVLYPVYDRSGPDTVPSDPVKLKLNTIGQSNWNMHGQAITWKVNAKKAGYYKIGVRFNQNLMRNLISYRRLYINGIVPFKEAAAIAFPFSDKWQTAVLGGGWMFYFKEGENTISLEATPGPVSQIIAELENTIYTANTIYRKIIMITSVNPDPNRDYELDSEIPGLLDNFKNIKESCEKAADSLAKLNGKRTAASTSALNSIIIQMDSFLKKKDTIAVRVSRLKDNISSLSTLLISLKNQPLEIDYLSVGSESLFYKKHSFSDGIKFSLQSFLGSFVEDYNSIGKTYEGAEPLNVWVNMGRDQTQIIKNMTDSMFTPETGIPVNISLVQQSLVQATLSSSGPDVVVFVGASDPVNLAARNALQDLSRFKGFDEIAKRFNSSAIVPYQYNGGYYALPITEDFPVLFYRTDIFKELNLTPPKTWAEFYKVLSVLQRNNMTAGIPNMPPDSQMSTNNNVFAMLLKQVGGSFYQKDLSKTDFDSVKAVDAFKMWTGFYARYGLPYQYDFYNRFRTGEMPIGIDSYTLINMLAVGAPEIKGLWDIASVPGTVKEDGTVDNSTYAGGLSILMFQKAKDKNAAFSYMDWFTRADIQAAYGLQIESLLGAAGRYNTANLEAFDLLPWSAKELSVIKKQRKTIFSVPQIPASYFVDRNLTNAFRAVVFSSKNPREVLLDYNKEINLEIQRKRIEFGLEKK